VHSHNCLNRLGWGGHAGSHSCLNRLGSEKTTQNLLVEANKNRRLDLEIQTRINASRARRLAATKEARQGQQIIGTGMGRVAAGRPSHFPVVCPPIEVRLAFLSMRQPSHTWSYLGTACPALSYLGPACPALSYLGPACPACPAKCYNGVLLRLAA
jgi:hypothetical protein